MDEDWQADLERWLAPYLEGLGNKTRRRMCPAYIAGLIGPGELALVPAGKLDERCCANGQGRRACALA